MSCLYSLRCLWLAGWVAAGLFGPAGACLAQSDGLGVCYRVTELDYSNLTNDVPDIYPIRLTDSGAFTGYIYHIHSPASMLYYSPATGFVDRGTWNGQATRGLGINESGQIAVLAWGAPHRPKMLRYAPATGYEELGTLGANDPDSEHGPRFINSRGDITGFSEAPSGESHAFRWTEAGGMEDLGTLPGGWYSVGTGITDDGWVSGTSRVEDGSPHIFLSRPGESMLDLGPGIGGDINNRGVIAGSDEYARPMLFYDGKGVRVRTPFGIASYSFGCLNEHNMFMGTYWDARIGVGFTAIGGSVEHGIVDLNKLIPTNSGWVLAEGTGLNNKCQIVGKGIYQGRNGVFRLDPVIPPVSIRQSGTNVMLSWARTFFPVQLEESGTLPPSTWQSVATTTNSVSLPLMPTSRFYRLVVKPPPTAPSSLP